MTAKLIQNFADELVSTLPTVTVRPALGKDYSLPAAIYSVRNGLRQLYYKDSWGLRTTEFTVTIYSKKYSELQELKGLVVAKFQGLNGSLGDSSISKITITNILDGYDDSLETIHRTTITLNVLD
ncbi:hypothetical protein EOK75_17220 (plasmid) [Pseudorhodobacter turbinis]|uniref:DUF3168 domain-containing protein n=1 Tax=Pseudorhodobacter turbinis TaxID=2500533 RepID=A0A4V1E1A5_9RHOB|nr:hypothetical protein [Pseudorhodobacter turbinis]QCO57454.1 hypothetical protein EOK75_17220 [Pseudorhodobacter turbinis]